MPDPLDQLGVEFAADHAASRAQRAAAEMSGATEGADVTAPEPKKTAAKKAKKDKASTAPEVTEEPAAEVIPPAPGEDAETVHDRRLERLANIVEEAEFDSGTVLGDMRDCILDLFKHRPKVWSAMSANEQQDTIRAVEKQAQAILRKIVLCIAQEDSESLQATFLGQFTVKGDAIEAKIKIDHIDGDGLLQAYGLAGQKIVIVSADDKRFASQRRDAEVLPDQYVAPLEFADDKPKATDPAPAIEPPADDSDLAGVEVGATEKAIVEQVADEAAKASADPAPEPKFGEAGYKEDAPADPPKVEDVAEFGVWDNARKEWLTSEDDDNWDTEANRAAKFSHERATEIADAFEAPGEVVVRALV